MAQYKYISDIEHWGGEWKRVVLPPYPYINQWDMSCDKIKVRFQIGLSMPPGQEPPQCNTKLYWAYIKAINENNGNVIVSNIWIDGNQPALLIDTLSKLSYSVENALCLFVELGLYKF